MIVTPDDIATAEIKEIGNFVEELLSTGEWELKRSELR